MPRGSRSGTFCTPVGGSRDPVAAAAAAGHRCMVRLLSSSARLAAGAGWHGPAAVRAVAWLCRCWNARPMPCRSSADACWPGRRRELAMAATRAARRPQPAQCATGALLGVGVVASVPKASAIHCRYACGTRRSLTGTLPAESGKGDREDATVPRAELRRWQCWRQAGANQGVIAALVVLCDAETADVPLLRRVTGPWRRYPAARRVRRRRHGENEGEAAGGGATRPESVAGDAGTAAALAADDAGDTVSASGYVRAAAGLQ